MQASTPKSLKESHRFSSLNLSKINENSESTQSNEIDNDTVYESWCTSINSSNKSSSLKKGFSLDFEPF